MDHDKISSSAYLSIYIFIHILFIIRVLLRPHRDPSSRIAWILVLIALPMFGLLCYVLVGETNIGHRRIRLMPKILTRLPERTKGLCVKTENLPNTIPARYAHLFQAGKAVNSFNAVEGNSAQLMKDSNSAQQLTLLFAILMPQQNISI